MYNENDNEYTDEESSVGCGGPIMFSTALFLVLLFALCIIQVMADVINENSPRHVAYINGRIVEKTFDEFSVGFTQLECEDVKVEEQLETEAKQTEARKKFVDDSIARYRRYRVLHDSLFEAMRVKDGINTALASQKKIKVDFIAFINDGVTSRQVVVNTVTDSLSPEDMTLLGNSFDELAYTAARERQNEIDHNEHYWKNVKLVNVGKEKDFIPVDISFTGDNN